MHGQQADGKGKGQAGAAPQHASDDWFLASIRSQQGLNHALDAAAATLNERLHFVAAIRQSLFGIAANEQTYDRITQLSGRITLLEQSLRVRLPLLRADRTAPWFRPSALSHGGPFSSQILSEPIFTAFHSGAGVREVYDALRQAWRQRTTGPLPMQAGSTAKESGDSLWTILLGLNAELAGLGPLPAPFAPLSLRDKALRLPPAIESLALREFCHGVRTELSRLDAQLATCYSTLEKACRDFWPVYDLEQTHSRSRRSGRGHADARGQSRASAEQQAGDQQQAGQRSQRTRQAWWGSRAKGQSEKQSQEQARAGAAKWRTPKDYAALKLMGFASDPCPSSLKQRYRELARQLHPDVPGGDEAAFKQLLAAYCHLQDYVRGKESRPR